MDAGPVYGVLTEAIKPTDTSGGLLDRLAVAGAELLVATLDGIETGELVPRPQPDEGVSLAPKLSVDDARVDWTWPAAAIGRQIRACTPAPGAWTQFHGTRLKLGPVSEARQLPPGQDVTLGPGELRVGSEGIAVGTGTSPALLGDVQPAGKRRMTAGEWARGLHLTSSDRREPGSASPRLG